MIRTTSPRSALKSHETDSLFKFQMHFHPESDEYRRKAGKPWIWYSYDFADERAEFLPGLPRDVRQFWTLALRKFWPHDDLYLFFRDCHPTFDEQDRLVMHFGRMRHPELLGLSQKYSDYVRRALGLLGVTSYTMRPQEGTLLPGHSPRRSKRDYHGIRAFEHNPQVQAWLRGGTLLTAKVFDNRCYHAENEYGLIVPPDGSRAQPVVLESTPVAVAVPGGAPPAARESATSKPVAAGGPVGIGGLMGAALSHLQPA